MAKQTIRRKVYKNLKDIVQWLDTKASPAAYSGSSLGQGVMNLDGRRLSTDTFYTVYRSSGDVYSAIRELSDNIGSQGLVYYNKDDRSKEASKSEVDAAKAFLESNVSFRKFKAELVQAAHISGNAYVHIEKGAGTSKPIGINFVDPRTMTVVTDKHGTVLRWIQKVKGQTVEFLPDEIAHFYIQKDPNSPVFGLSPLEPIFWEVRTDQQAMISNFVFFENNAVPAAQYIIDDELTDDEQEKAVEALRAQIKGANNQHRSVAIKGVKDIKTLSLSAKDMEFNLLRRFTTEKICAAYGVPKSILGYTDGVNLANGQEQTKKFWEGTIQPFEEVFAEFLNEILFPKLGIQTVAVEFNTKDFQDKQWNEASTRADLAQGVLTINEVREARGLEPFENSKEGEYVDKPMIANGMGVVPVEDVGVDLGDIAPIDSEDKAIAEIEKIKKAAERYQYGRTDQGDNSK